MHLSLNLYKTTWGISIYLFICLVSVSFFFKGTEMEERGRQDFHHYTWQVTNTSQPVMQIYFCLKLSLLELAVMLHMVFC